MFTSFIERLERMDYCIRTKSTGSSHQFARKIGISLRSLHDYLNLLKGLGAPISYCKQRNCYYYRENGNFCFKFSKKDSSEPLE
ncbi:hypothetical protein SAMN05661099_1206 [Daejeonella lutea]|uniref:HTH domain-containing protein n=1 Tax=Daejeonella lutea TaxID=572036 RepID=A0A1T5B1S1_9SPHI|nr:hypothetical protein SAMN05661099_1206 [Daejeonella lutea]